MTTIQPASETTATGRPHYAALDSLRGVCACAVVFYHMATTGALTNMPFFRNAWLLTDFFFVLSGFVISVSYGDKLAGGYSVRRFMTLRLGRVYPLHLAMILAFVAMEVAAMAIGRADGARLPFTDTRSPGTLLTNLTLTQIFGFHQRVTWNHPSWSIAAEAWTYLIVALALTTLRTKARPAIIVGAVLMPLWLAWLDAQGLDRTYSWALVRCLYGFLLGMIVHDVHRTSGSVRLDRASASFLEVLAVASVAFCVSAAPGGRITLLFPPLFAVAVLVFAKEGGVVSQLLGTRAFRTIGALSYSIYMTHVLVIGRMADALAVVDHKLGTHLAATMTFEGGPAKGFTGPGVVPDLLAIACLGAIVGVSWITYRLIEIPFRDMSRRLADRIGRRDRVPQAARA